MERNVLPVRGPPSAADHDALGEQALARRDDLADNVLQTELALIER
jgi:hypothetical protein